MGGWGWGKEGERKRVSLWKGGQRLREGQRNGEKWRQKEQGPRDGEGLTPREEGRRQLQWWLGNKTAVTPVSLCGSLVLSPFLPIYTILDFIYSFIFGCPGSWLLTGFPQLRCVGASLVMERRL